MQTDKSFPAAVTSPAAARRFVAGVLGGSEEARQVALILTSELVTNAVVHARTPVNVRVRVDETGTRVEVADGDRRLPEPTNHSPDALGGRGLHLVRELASDWGADLRPEGKVIWFSLDADRRGAAGSLDADRYAPRGVHG